MIGRKVAGAALLAVAAGATSGCSQLAVLKPVAGDAVTSVNNATSDVLANEGVDVMTWPVCTFTDTSYTCTGATVDGQPIVGTANNDEAMILTVKVGDRTVFQGPVKSVIEKAGQAP